MNAYFIGIIGESRCVKPTLLCKLVGTENPDKGEILINNLSTIKDKKLQKLIGYVFQIHKLFPHFISMTLNFPQAFYVTINREDIIFQKEIEINNDIRGVLGLLLY